MLNHSPLKACLLAEVIWPKWIFFSWLGGSQGNLVQLEKWVRQILGRQLPAEARMRTEGLLSCMRLGCRVLESVHGSRTPTTRWDPLGKRRRSLQVSGKASVLSSESGDPDLRLFSYRLNYKYTGLSSQKRQRGTEKRS